jgi:hypothetical protein
LVHVGLVPAALLAHSAAVGKWRPRRPRRGGRAAPAASTYLETRKGAVDVVDARVARPGTLPPEVLECCREVLRGLELDVSVAEQGARFRYLYEIEE